MSLGGFNYSQVFPSIPKHCPNACPCHVPRCPFVSPANLQGSPGIPRCASMSADISKRCQVSPCVTLPCPQVSLSNFLSCPQVSPHVPKFPPCPHICQTVSKCLQVFSSIPKCACPLCSWVSPCLPFVSPMSSSDLRCPSMSSSVPWCPPLALPCVSPSLCWQCPCMLPVSPAVPKVSPHVPVLSPHGAGSGPRCVQGGSGRSHGHRSHHADRAGRGDSLWPPPPPPPRSVGLGTVGHGHWG